MERRAGASLKRQAAFSLRTRARSRPWAVKSTSAKGSRSGHARAHGRKRAQRLGGRGLEKAPVEGIRSRDANRPKSGTSLAQMKMMQRKCNASQK